MNREIKFRGINTDTNKWVVGYGCIYSEKYGSQVIHAQGINIAQHTQVIPETLGQFTGLKDKNGKEIYEGDICAATFKDKHGIHEMEGEIKMDDFMWCIDCTGRQDAYSDLYSINRIANIEVAGNIYENPELLTTL